MAYGLQGRYGRGIVAVEKVCDGGLGKAGFFSEPVVCPAAFIHKVFYMFYDIHFHHRHHPSPFVSILVSKWVI